LTSPRFVPITLFVVSLTE